MTSMPLLDTLTKLRFTDVKWDYATRPVVIADGRVMPVMELDSLVHARAAYVVGVNQRHFDHLVHYLRTDTVHFYEMRVADISALPLIGAIKAIRISWNTRSSRSSPSPP